MLRQLGGTGLSVSPIGLGTVKFGRNQGVKYPRGFALPTDIEIISLLDLALELGINLLDTAPAYGTSEERLGQLLGSRRQEFLLATKVGEEFLDGKSTFDFSAGYVLRSVERSLQRLKTDYLDALLIHSDGNDLQILEQTDAPAALLGLKQKGLVRAVGMSTKTVEGGLAALEQLDLAMVTYNLQATEEKAVIDAAQQNQKGILVKKAFASGHHLCGQGEMQPTLEASLGHVFAAKGVSSIIIGTLNPEHLRANVKATRNLLR